MSQSIGIIGGGFSGMMTAVQLINQVKSALEIYIVEPNADIGRGIAYNPYSERHILNVVASKMSAFPDQPDHFLDWVMALDSFKTMDRAIIAQSFLSRKLYGDYLSEVWKKAVGTAKLKGINLTEIHDTVVSLKKIADKIELSFGGSPKLLIDRCIIATGNQIPKNPTIPNETFYNSSNYFQNPWTASSVENLSGELPILILGNGLTMVDTIMGLLENKYRGEIYSISPNGFNILPHRHGGMKYTAHLNEIQDRMPLVKWVNILNRHIKIVRQYGVSAEPLIDALRPYTQKIWRGLTSQEKALFMARLRHLFGVARHRIPLHIHDKIQQLRINHILHIQSGKILDMQETENGILVDYYDKKLKEKKQLQVSRVINCTGPESDFSKLDNHFLSTCITDGLMVQDELKLGIKTNIDSFKIIDKADKEQANLYTLGSNLRGELWESTAVNELRQQAAALASLILLEMS